jgi:hypothetical protein
MQVQKDIKILHKTTESNTEKKTIAPCEKLNVAEALKIRTNPKATNEYIVPASKPPTKLP